MIPTRIRIVPALLATTVGVAPAIADDRDTAVAHFLEFYGQTRPGFSMRDTNEAAPSVEAAMKSLRTLGADGAWSDLDYRSKARSSWPAALHVNRMAGMAGAALHAKPADRAGLLDATHRAFAGWIARDPQCVNWWYNDIGVPKSLATVALLLGDGLLPAEKDYLLAKIAPRTAIAKTGQNRLWLAGNTLMLGLIARDDARISKAAAVIADEIRVTTEEGIQPDFSFHQHGAQQQFGNYGLAFATEIARWAGVLRDTRWKLPEAKLAIYRDYLLRGQNVVSWRGAMDLGSCGRQFMPGTPALKTRSISGAMTEAAFIDPEHAPEYRAFVARNRPGAPNDLVGTTWFWRSDYLVHRLPELFFSLKMSSARVVGMENTNGENLSGHHIADGMLLAYGAGNDYEEIPPVWNWRRVPGTTAPASPLPKGFTHLKTRFVGAVTDGATAVAALDYAKYDVVAHKAWFFTPEGVLALGAGITSGNPAAVTTSVQQSRLRGKVTSGAGFVEHAGLRYTFPDGATPRRETGPVTGNWSKIYNNPSTPKEDVTLPVFSLFFEHGVKPKNAAYAYFIGKAGVAPATSPVTNTPALQVAKLDASRTGYVFWEAGASGDIAVDAPCVLIRDTAKNTVVIADPAQRLKSLVVTVAGKKHVVAPPQGAAAGASACIPLD